MRIFCNLALFLALSGTLVINVAQPQSPPRNLSGAGAFGCSPAPCVLPPTQASEGGALVNTPSIAVDPLNSKHLVLGADDFNCGFSASYTSADGGSSWAGPFCLPDLNQNGRLFSPGTDPTVGYDRNGVAYIAAPYFFAEGSNITGFVAFSKSSDGINWSQPTVALSVAKSFQAYSWLTVDTNPGSPHVNSLYVSGVAIGPPGVQSENAVVVAHSVDGGDTWTTVVVAGMQISPEVDHYTNITIGKDGTVYLAWMYCNSGPYICDNHKAYMVFSKSTDGGNTWSRPTLMTTVTLAALANSTPGVTDYPAIGVDNSNGQNAGALYVVLNTWTGTYLRVGVIHSTDGGNTWSKPVPVAPAKYTHDQFFPWLSVSSTGLVGVSWLDRRNDPANIDYQAFAAISTDGGQSFQPNVQLTAAFSNPNVNGYPENLWMGDYAGNTWDGPNYFVAAWMDSSNGIDMQEVVAGIRLH